MARVKLPQPGKVGASADDMHLRAAAQHVARCPDGKFTEAYLDLARRARELSPLPDQPPEKDDASDSV